MKEEKNWKAECSDIDFDEMLLNIQSDSNLTLEERQIMEEQVKAMKSLTFLKEFEEL